MNCSIIICTRNRAPMLQATLRAFNNVRVPQNFSVELIIADNGSDDDTAEIVRSARHPAIEIFLVQEPRPGKSRAQNAALAFARGDALLFTDDDVEPSCDWIECMARPLLDRRCDAVAGRIILSDDLRRPWFTHMHRIWLAEVESPTAESPELVGANMGIHRSVFKYISKFDEELGPGITGFGEETLVWRQMKEAGLRIVPVDGSYVVHHPEPSRLLRSGWLNAASCRGRTHAYVTHHWEHQRIHCPKARALIVAVKLALRRVLQGPRPLHAEGCADWEMSYVAKLVCLRQFIIESRKPRNYGIRSLRKNTEL